jgi:lycopene cyclase domain-containing protein
VIGHGAYLRYELWWALPVILVQWLAAWRELWRWRMLLSAAILLSTLYLGACDGFALGHGIWRVDPSRVVGISIGSLPLEELIFYFLTNTMAAQGFILIAGFLRERQKRSLADNGRQKQKDSDVELRISRGAIGRIKERHAVTSENPYRKPILGHCRRLHSIRWAMPFLPQAVIALALLVILCALLALYVTIGIAAQISEMCLLLMADARQQFGQTAAVEKSAYVVAILVYALLFIPFWLVQTPILLIGWGIEKLAEGASKPNIRRASFSRHDYISPRFSGMRH